MSRLRPTLLIGLGLLLARGGSLAASDWSGHVAVETRGFASRPVGADQATHSGSISFSLQPEYFREWAGGDQLFLFTGFFRYDARDGERTHADLRDLYWQAVGRSWELSVGVRTVFWGVTESQHLVDIINQTDLVEDIDGEEKLGQPMARLSWFGAWGTFDVYLLPGFRERTFPGADGRLRTSPRVDPDAARYESGAGREHVDWALRWFRTLGDWDLGVAHFSGTGREPRLVPGLDRSREPVLKPFYEQIDQTSLDLQVTKGGWLWKLESISRRDLRERFGAATGGFEYTFADLRGSGADVGVLGEYLYDERGERAPTPFQDDLFVATRLALNDVQDTRLLAAATIDRDSGATFLDLQGSRRLGADFRLSAKLRAFLDVPEADRYQAIARDDYLELEIARYF